MHDADISEETENNNFSNEVKTTGAAVVVKPSPFAVGDGLFAVESIAKGDFIVEYIGKKIPTKEADVSKSRYLFELDTDWTIEGPPESNIAGYINHSCDPNAEADIHDEHILITAVRRIKAGEEITIDYGDEYFDEFIKPTGCRCTAKKHR